MYVLTVNGGSSSFKFSVYFLQNKSLVRLQSPVWKKSVEFKNRFESREESILKALKEITYPIDMVCHRVVHGGKLFTRPTIINKHVKKSLLDLNYLAPLHNPINLEGIEIAEKILPQAKHVAVFDTAFFSNLSDVACTYPIPKEWTEEGIKRFGFHGISHKYCFETLQTIIPNSSEKKMIICHLGNGCSCTAIDQDKAIDTSMGFTPMEGLMMGTRSGSIDPGIIFYLMRYKGYQFEEIDHALNKESGLFGICKDFDMRKIVERMNALDREATLAFDLYIHRLKKVIGELTASLEGLDVLCFTAGIGENCHLVREKVCTSLKFLGVQIDPSIDCKIDCVISAPSSKVNVCVVHTNEEFQMIKDSLNIIHQKDEST